MGNWSCPHIVVHRGSDKLVPESTLTSIDVGAEYGHKMIELNARLLKDGGIPLLHDDSLERTSNGWSVMGKLNWQDLLHVDADSWYSKMFEGEPLPLLSQVVEHCHEHGMAVNIEIKPTTGTEPPTGKTVALVAHELQAGMTPPLLSSFEIDVLETAQQAVPELPRGLLLDEWHDDWHKLTAWLGRVSVHLNHRLLNKAQVMQLKDAGLRILVYAVNRPQRVAELLRQGVDYIYIDAIGATDPGFTTRQFSTKCQAAVCWTDSACRRFSSPAAYTADSTSCSDYGCCLTSRRWCWTAFATERDFTPLAVTATPAENCHLSGLPNAAAATEFVFSIADSASFSTGFAESASGFASVASWVSDTPAG